jgi:creatinine amidohydrolase/Fe(II)-dependent formamide hydrolase-like protein
MLMRSDLPAAPPISAPVSRRVLLASGVVAGVAALAATRPLTAAHSGTLMLAEMSWVELRSAVANGFTSVIVPSGGIEQNGLHMILDKHQHIVRHAAGEIARRSGQMLVAPVVAFVPEGGFAPASGNMRFPGTIGVSEAVFEGLLADIGRSLALAGFRTVYFIADHGQSQAPQERVAQLLNAETGARGARHVSLGAYYAAGDRQMDWLRAQGESAASIGDHAGLLDTSELLAVHPEGVRLAALADARFRLADTGASGDPARARADWGRALLDLKIEAAVAAIHADRQAALRG